MFVITLTSKKNENNRNVKRDGNSKCQKSRTCNHVVLAYVFQFLVVFLGKIGKINFEIKL